MLYLLDTPSWKPAQLRWDLPDTLPGWTVAFLAVQSDWTARERLWTLLWPDADSAAAQHNLRVNLYRVRMLLETWGVGDALQVERRRIRLNLPTDVTILRRELASANPADSLTRYRQPFLSSSSFPGFASFDEWVRAERAALHALWRRAALARLAQSDLPVEPALDLCERMLLVDPFDEEAVAQQLRLLAAAGRSDEARRTLQEFATQSREQLGVEPSSSLTALLSERRANGAPAYAHARHAFIGRATELRQLEAMLVAGAGRVFTLKGPGGVGKSRLARELTLCIGEQWPDGVVWVDLADLAQAAEALPRLAGQLGLTLAPQREVKPQILSAIGARQGLIVLDNAEHITDCGALVADLCRAAPRSTWLVTSRTPLFIDAERTFTLDGLESPETDATVTDLDAALRFDAMALLVARACDADPDFDVIAHWRSCLELIRITGGWPLAIELAAGALAWQEIDAIVVELRQSIDALATARGSGPVRHHSIRASLDLSWQLLGPAEQRMLAGLGVMRGAFTRPCAIAVGGAAATTLASLLERSLVQVEGAGRFRLHPLVVQFAAERLAENDQEQKSAERRHAEYFAARIAAGAATGDGEIALLDEIEGDFQNFCAAWTTLVNQGAGNGLEAFATAWSNFGTVKGRGRELIPLVASATTAAAPSTSVHVALLQALANLHYRCGELDAAQAIAREGLAAAATAGDERCRSALLNTLALALKDLGRYDEAEACALDALRAARTVGRDRETASNANTCAILAKMRGDYGAAAALYGEALAIHRRTAHHRGLAICLNNLGNVHRALGDGAAAQLTFEECLRVSERRGIASTHAYALVNLALTHQEAGRYGAARSFAERARAAPAAEIAVLLAAETVMLLCAIDASDLEGARTSMRALALRARATGLHAALLDTVQCHAKLLVAMGERDQAIARFRFLGGHPLLPAMQRIDVERCLSNLKPSIEEVDRADTAVRAFALEPLIEDALAVEAKPARVV
jgi:predicted ATPase/DNA-binding SARP family transcriptional activator